MKTSALEEEIAFLRREVEILRQEKSKVQSRPKPRSQVKSKAKLSGKAAEKKEDTIEIEAELKQLLTEILRATKKDYENLSPVTALLLFALGAMLGGVLAKSRGGR
ncbi:MAG: hypothetical protein P1U61_00600 [Legionellaceae bacterium]|nr:hypothetical protein [Legionellaceae bacterium]